MATQFIGLRLRATLDGPERTQLYGVVEDVADQRLTLHDVTFPNTGVHLPAYYVHSSQIADLEILPEQPVAAPTTHQASLAEQPSTAQGVEAPGLSAPARQAGNTASANVLLGDPAIISVSRAFSKSTISTETSKPNDTQQSNHGKPERTGLPVSIQFGNSSGVQESVRTGSSVQQESLLVRSAKENVRPSDDYTGAGPSGSPATQSELATPKGHAGQRVRRNGSPAKAKSPHDTAPVSGPSSSPLVADREDEEVGTPWLGRQVKRFGNNLQPPGSTRAVKGSPNPLPVFRSNHKPRRRHAPAADYTDGWATEEATDIQGMGEFDFQENLSKFDKRSVFDQIRADDLTADEDRLVQLNRRPARLGTAGGKNLHHTENVLDDIDDAGTWNSEAGETEADVSEVEHASSRSLRRTTSRQSIKRLPHRKGSIPVESIGRNSSSAKVLSPSTPAPSIFAQLDKARQEHRPTAGASLPQASLRLSRSNRYCPVVGPVQMLEIERLAQSELALTEEMMTENAARGIAEVAFKALGARDRRWLSGRRNGSPVMAILAGNNQTGVRAVAAARHLCNHGVRVHVCLLGYLEHELHITDEMRRQLAILKESGGRQVLADDFTGSPYIVKAPPEIIIDALFGMHLSFGDLSRQDQTLAYNLIKWANRSRADVVAVDVPTGIDASSGKTQVALRIAGGGQSANNRHDVGLPAAADGASLCIRPNYVVAMGAPKAGILNALASDKSLNWKLYVADLGISNTIWRKHGTRRRQGVDFGPSWVAELTYQEGGY